jgi:hypothetical protein
MPENVEESRPVMTSAHSTRRVDPSLASRRLLLLALIAVLLAIVAIVLATTRLSGVQPPVPVASRESLMQRSSRGDIHLDSEVGEPLPARAPSVAQPREDVAQPSAVAVAPVPISGSLFGWVRDPEHRSDRFHGGKLHLRYQSGSPAAPVSDSSSRAAAREQSIEIRDDGSFDARDLDLGTWVVRGKIAGCAPLLARVVLGAGANRVRLDFDLDPDRVVTIDLVDGDGNPFLDSATRDGCSLASLVAPFACATEPSLAANPLSNERVLRSRSVVRGKGKPWCTLTIEASQHDRVWVGAAIANRTLAFREVSLGVEHIALATSTDVLSGALGALTVHVVDDLDSVPIHDASVFLPNTLPTAPTQWTDAGGQAWFEGLVEGEIQVRVRVDDYVTANRSVRVRAGNTTALEVRLERAVWIAGVVRDGEGRPRGGLYLRAMPATGDASRWEYERSTMTEADGAFVLKGLAHREYVLMDASTKVSKSSWPQITRSSVPPGATYVDARVGNVDGVSVLIPLPKGTQCSSHSRVRQ